MVLNLRNVLTFNLKCYHRFDLLPTSLSVLNALFK